MPVDLNGTLRRALSKLEAEKARIERQIAGLRQALDAGMVTTETVVVRRAGAKRNGRRRMSLASRKAASVRMKAYWAKRRGKKNAA
jgi:hypothetical protein